MFKVDNASPHCVLEEATRSTACSASIKPFSKKDDMNAWLSIIKQRAGDEQWKRQLDLSEDSINTKVWKGNESHPLADHVAKHRNSYVSMVQCSSHISYQLPNDLTRVRKLMRSIE